MRRHGGSINEYPSLTIGKDRNKRLEGLDLAKLKF